MHVNFATARARSFANYFVTLLQKFWPGQARPEFNLTIYRRGSTKICQVQKHETEIIEVEV